MARLAKQNRRQKSLPPHLSPQEINRLVSQVAIQLALKSRGIRFIQTNTNSLIYIPRMDIVDDPNSARMAAIFELPGVRHDQVSVTVRHGVMRVCGRRVPRKLQELCGNTTPDTGESNSPNTGSAIGSIQAGTSLSLDSNRYPVQELRYGYFKRELKLPNGTKEGDMAAMLKEGLLVVTWPRCSNESSNAASGQEESTSEPVACS
ncbi:hypothetical protein APHAL10511_007254 [Amanita phalloides]|nr:hypothetical protein APHAL10511_007254 [Amanita phalloides]